MLKSYKKEAAWFFSINVIDEIQLKYEIKVIIILKKFNL